jgi:preprotein translocase subunit SecF
LLEREFTVDPNFRKSIDRLEVYALLEFRPAAMAFLRMFFEDLTAFTLDLRASQWAEMFVIMVAAGFFQLTGSEFSEAIVASFLQLPSFDERALTGARNA